MADFNYRALDAKGRTRRGQISATDEPHARQLLRGQQLNPLSLTQHQNSSRLKSLRLFSPRQRLGTTTLALIVRQLATMVASGQPLAEALNAIALQATQPARQILQDIREKVIEGQDIATALAHYPEDFPPLYIAAVAAGESTGRLDQVLNELAAHAEHSRELKQSVLLALTYPILLALVAGTIVVALLAYVMPQVVEVFDTLDVQLPLLTRILLGLSDLIRQFGWLAVLAGAVLISIVTMIWRTPTGRFRMDRMILQIPMIGSLVSSKEIGQFTRTMSMVCGSAVPVPDALQLAASAVKNRPIHAAVVNAQREVTDGQSLYLALESSGYFPPLVLQLIHSGESSGNLAELLRHAANLLETEFQSRVKMLVGLLEPALILAMGGVVLLIVLAILVPVLDLNTLVH